MIKDKMHDQPSRLCLLAGSASRRPASRVRAVGGKLHRLPAVARRRNLDKSFPRSIDPAGRRRALSRILPGAARRHRGTCPNHTLAVRASWSCCTPTETSRCWSVCAAGPAVPARAERARTAGTPQLEKYQRYAEVVRTARPGVPTPSRGETAWPPCCSDTRVAS